MKRFFTSVLVCCILPPTVLGFTRIRTSGGDPIKQASTSVQFALNDKIASAPNILPGGDPIAALNAARQEWNQWSTSAINFLPFTTTSRTLGANDGINIVSFSDNSPFINDTDTLAITVIIFGNSSGTILDTDLLFNPKVTFFINPGSGGFDMQSVATHEFGHSISADHTAVQSATMFQSSGELEFFQRTLDFDDIAFVSTAYPTSIHPFGSISGKVLSGSTPVFGAHVVAYDASKNIYVSGVSLRDGSYFIDGLPPGNYLIYAEPFDGPVTLSSLFSGQINSFFGSASTKFMTSSGPAQALSVGQNLQNIDVSVPSGDATLNATKAGRNFSGSSDSANSFLIGAGPVLVSPGEGQSQPITLVVIGDGITKDATDLRLDVEGSGITIKARGKGAFQSGTGFVFVDVAVAPDATPGTRQLKVTSGGQTSYYTAGLVVAERAVTQTILRFPAVRQSSSEFTGIGITNLSDKSAVIRALYFDSTGELIAIPGMQNPAFLSVPAGGQSAKLSQEIFQTVQNESGWVELQSDQAQVYAFFLAGDFALTKLDGSDVPSSALTDGIFTDVRQNSTSQTEINVANFNTLAATLTFNFVSALGQKLGPVSRTVGARANLRETAAQLFPGIVSDVGYITFHSTLPVNALELVSSVPPACQPSGTGCQLVSLNAQDQSAVPTTLISSHFAVGNAGLVFFTRLNLVNPGNQPVQAVIEARDASGRIIASPTVFVNAQTILKLEVADTFGLLPGGPAVIGSITVRSLSGGALFGSVLIGDGTTNNNFASEFPLESAATLGTNLLFEQLATASGFVTGIAVYNPGPNSAQITVEAHSPDGTLLGLKQQALGPNQKLTNQIIELVPTAANRSGGYIRVRSDQPVSAIVLFLTTSGSFLSAVPASKVVP
ncbi:MAG TPA: matrixin family metalloprotease [Acidobacteriota bacterium]|nr:matrixin family metalloprotease [Acidobacteriota bacterium]